MKNKKTFWYIGYGVSFLLVLLILLMDFPVEVEVGLGMLFSAVFAVSHTQILHNKMLCEDHDYKVNVMDERNIMIKEKAGNITNMVTLVLLGCATVAFIVLEYTVPAIIIGGIICVQPIILISISRSIEKRL